MDGQTDQSRDAGASAPADNTPVSFMPGQVIGPQAGASAQPNIAPAAVPGPELPAPVATPAASQSQPIPAAANSFTAPAEPAPELPAPVDTAPAVEQADLPQAQAMADAPAVPETAAEPVIPDPENPPPYVYTEDGSVPADGQPWGPVDMGDTDPSQADPGTDDDLQWTAAEFVAHEKSGSWYLFLAGGALVVMGLAYLVSREIFPVIIIAICAGLFGFMASRQPREMPYALSTQGITIGPKFYPYSHFNSFSVIEEGPFSSIDFMPLKRFSPVLSIPYDPEHATPIVGILANHLPVSQHKRTWIDRLMASIHF